MKDWVAAENRMTFDYLAKLPMRITFGSVSRSSGTIRRHRFRVREAGQYFYEKNGGLQRQSPIYMRSSLTAPATLLLDPNTISPDGSVSLAQWKPSRDGRLLAYGLSEGGADWRTLHVRDIRSGKDLPDEVRWMRFSDISWTNDGKGFFYSRYPEPPKGKALAAALSGHAVYYHWAGTPQSHDRLIYSRKDLPTWFQLSSVTEDGRYLVLLMAKGSTPENRLYYADLGNPKRPRLARASSPSLRTTMPNSRSSAMSGPCFIYEQTRNPPTARLSRSTSPVRRKPTGKRLFRRER